MVLLRVFGEEFLGGDQAFAELEVGKGEFGFGDDLFEGADDGDGVHVVEEAEVGDAEELALHLALAVGDDGGELRLEALDDDAGVGAFGRQDGGGCGCFVALGREELEAEGCRLRRGSWRRRFRRCRLASCGLRRGCLRVSAAACPAM